MFHAKFKINENLALVISAVSLSKGITRAADTISYAISNYSSIINNRTTNTPQPTVTSPTSNPDSPNSNTMNLFETANYLKVPENELIQLIDSKSIDLPCTRINNNYIFTKSAVDKWLETKHSIDIK